MPKRKKRTGILSAVLILAAGVFAALAVREYLPYWSNEFSVRLLKMELEEAVQDEGDAKKKRKNKDWDKLQGINEDIIAWIEVPGTKIDYPILRSPSFSYYLHRDFRKRKNVLGSVFVQPEVAEELSGQHIIIYGHNMRDKQMFGLLHNFESEKFFKEHKDVYIYQPGQILHAAVYSAYDCMDATDTYKTEFDSEDAWGEWQEMTVRRSCYHTGTEPKASDQVITLSTCSNGKGRRSRYVVNCVVREKEQAD